MFDLQKLVDAVGESNARTRSDYHLTLGGLIKKLNAIEDKSLVVAFSDGNHPGAPDSYRGYYSDLSFCNSDKPITVGHFLDEANACLGETFMGYKGGDYVMHEKTPLWRAEYGHSGGEPIIDLVATPAGAILITKVIDDD